MSSKTRAEMEAWRELLDNHDSFIVENGGAVVMPEGETIVFGDVIEAAAASVFPVPFERCQLIPRSRTVGIGDAWSGSALGAAYESDRRRAQGANCGQGLYW